MNDGLQCASCGKRDTHVVDSRANLDGTFIRRRRECLICKGRFTTYEKAQFDPVEESALRESILGATDELVLRVKQLVRGKGRPVEL